MLSVGFDNELFTNEINILQSAINDLNNQKLRQKEFIEKYSLLIVNYEKLLKLSSKAIKISDSQGKELSRREYEIRNLLDNSNQGFLTFGKNLLVNKQYSSECIRLFKRKITNINILKLLISENNEQNQLFQLVFNMVFSNENTKEQKLSYIKKLPNMLKINENYININYKLICNEDIENQIESILLIITDITEKKKTEDQILYLSYHDKLTSLYNRTYIDNVISQLQIQSNMPLSVIMADMNGLKLVNDVFGHEAGDTLLINASNLFKECCKNNEIVARWGGDEFLIILPDTDNILCSKICKQIKDMCANFSPNPIELSVSLGSATVDNPNTSISELFKIAESEMYSNKLSESKIIKRKIILNLENILHEKCSQDFGHNTRVKNMTLNFAKIIDSEITSNEVNNLSLFASLHDIGKVSIPKKVLSKNGPLSPSEWEIMKNYTKIGFRMAQSIDEPLLAQSILHLREHWDGNGYPYGLKGEEIPLHSRIVSIIETFDVMIHNKSYKKVLSEKEAIEELTKYSGKYFDPHLITLFLDNYKSL